MERHWISRRSPASIASPSTAVSVAQAGRPARRRRRCRATCALEDELGGRLVECNSRTLRLAEEGTAPHARTEGLFNEIQEIVEASAERLRGRLRVSVPVLFTHMATSRIAEGFAKSYPDIRLDLSADDRNVDVVAEQYDVVVRVDPQPDQSLVGRCFLKDQRVVVAAPPHALPELGSGSHRSSVPAVIRSGAAASPVWQVGRDDGTVEIGPESVLCVSSLLMVRDAGRRTGIGAAVLPHPLIADDLAAGHPVA